MGGLGGGKARSCPPGLGVEGGGRKKWFVVGGKRKHWERKGAKHDTRIKKEKMNPHSVHN